MKYSKQTQNLILTLFTTLSNKHCNLIWNNITLLSMNTSISNNWTRRSEDRRVHPPALGVSRVINLIFYFFRYSQSVKYAKFLLFEISSIKKNNLDRNSLVKIQYFKFENELSKTSYFIWSVFWTYYFCQGASFWLPWKYVI